MMEKCGDVVDVWKKFRSPYAKHLNVSEIESRGCMEHVALKMRWSASVFCTCRSACEEITYSAEEKRIEATFESDYQKIWRLNLYKDTAVTEVKLVRDFPAEMFFGTFGGVLGLGGKFQTVFQLVMFLFLCMNHIFRR